MSFFCCYLNKSPKEKFINKINNYIQKNVINNNDIEIKLLNENYDQPNECFVCLDQVIENKKLITINCCNVQLHSSCFKEWCLIKKNIVCPICNKNLKL